MKKQTAVEWLWDESQSRELQASDFEKALAMEKEQIVDACNLQRSDYRGMPTYNKSGEQYYNEIYGTQTPRS